MTTVHRLPTGLWYAFRAGMLYEQRNELISRARDDKRGSWQRRSRARYARRCNWEMLRLMRIARREHASKP